ncbi:MAG: NAD-dependent epimerase/dehydratase family protein [Myxococcales bacterium]|nr:NAD(P)-dependent oxidoreductase [Myxococcales bacterium]
MYPVEELDEVVDATLPLWERLRGGRLLITGATGFFGSWLVQTFARANARLSLDARVVAVARRPGTLRGLDPAVEPFEADVRGPRLPEGPFSHVIHAATAASAQLNDQQPLEMASVIVDGTRRILEIANGARFLFVSSGAVYGPQTVPQVAEDHQGGPDPLNPRNAYAEAKRLAELWSVSTMPTVVARAFAFVGPGLPLDVHFAIGNFIADGLAKRPIIVKGDGSTVRSYLYASDLAIWLWTLLFDGRPGRAYNVGSEEAVSIRELAHAVGAHFAVPVEIRGTPVPGKPVDRYVPSTRRAREELGLAQRVPLREAIRRTARWHEVNRR